MRTVEIGCVVEPVKKWNPKRESDGAFTYVDISSIDQHAKAVSEPSSVDAIEAPSRARQLIASGDVLVSTVRPNLNAVAYVKPELDGATASTGYCVLRPRPSDLDGRYLFHWVRAVPFIGYLVQRATGASYPAVSDKIVKEAPIPLPTIEEQRRIAAVLDAADALRAKRRQALAKLDSLTQAVFLDMFGDPVRNERDWPIKRLSDVVREGTTVTYGIVQAGDEFPGGIPYVRTGDISDGRIHVEGLRRTDPKIAERFPRSRVRVGEIVMSIRATVGTTAEVPAALDGANLTQGTARIAPSNVVIGVYLLEYLRSDAAQRWIQRQVKGATFREITLKRLRELPVMVPPLGQQQEFAVRRENADRLRLVFESSLDGFDRLFGSLQQRAFRGEL